MYTRRDSGCKSKFEDKYVSGASNSFNNVRLEPPCAQPLVAVHGTYSFIILAILITYSCSGAVYV